MVFLGPGIGILGSGASYGGLGGQTGSHSLVYGDIMDPINFGSGAGSPGGGRLYFKVTKALRVEGKYIKLMQLLEIIKYFDH